jgi:two-component system, sensor histidine kinase LadS
MDAGTIAATCRALAKQNVELKLTIRRLKRLAYVDALTGLGNRRYLEVALDCEIRRAARGTMPLTFMLCDVDHFKHYNDRFGHQCGDAVLRAVGETLCRYCRRAGDIAARYGGEEFALLLPGIDSAETIRIAERLRQSVAGLSIRHAKDEEPEHITISIGVTTFRSSEPCAASDVIRAADLALYRAKGAGRNRTKYQAAKFAAGRVRHGGQGALNFAS